MPAIDDEWDSLVRFDVDSLIAESNRRVAALLDQAVAEQDQEPELSAYWIDLGGSE